MRFREQAERQGTVMPPTRNRSISRRPFKVWVGEDENILPRRLRDRRRGKAGHGLEGEDKLKNKGVSACTVCDGALFQRRRRRHRGWRLWRWKATCLSGLCNT